MPKDRKIKIIDEEFMGDLRIALKETFFYDDWQESYAFVRQFEPPLINKSPQIPERFREELRQMIIQAKWIALPSLKDDEIVELFKNHFLVQFNLPGEFYDIWRKLRAKLTTIGVYEDRDKLRHRIRDVLIENEESIVSKGPLDNRDKPLQPTIKNWLMDYNRTLGTGKIDVLKLNSYITKHPVANKLPDKEKARLKSLFYFYGIVRLSSLDPEGYEEVISVYDERWGPGTIEAGRFVPRDKKDIEDMDKFIKKLEEVGAWGEKLDEAIARGDFGELDAGEPAAAASGLPETSGSTLTPQVRLQKSFQIFITSPLVINAFKRRAEGDLGTVRNTFYHAVNEGQAEAVLGALFTMAENKQIRRIFEGDERFKKFWGEYLEKQGLDVKEFEKDVAAEKYIAMFLQYILEKRLNMKKDEAVLVGVSMANLARKSGEVEYESLAYGDLEEGIFKWNI